MVQLLVEMLAPYKGRVYDPCCGSGGMFVQSEKFVEAHGGKSATVHLRPGVQPHHLAAGAHEPRHPRHRGQPRRRDARHLPPRTCTDLKADYILANPPFNVSDWGRSGCKDDVRWKYGRAAGGERELRAGCSTSSTTSRRAGAGVRAGERVDVVEQSGEGEIRKALVEADLVDCMVALPGQLFYSTQIPVCLWFLARDKGAGKFRDRRGQMLFIDARKLGTMVTRVHRELTDEDLARIAGTYHAWRGDTDSGTYEDVAGFCRAATVAVVRKHGHVLTPGRYVGVGASAAESESAEDKFTRLVGLLKKQQLEARTIDERIMLNLNEVGLDG